MDHVTAGPEDIATGGLPGCYVLRAPSAQTAALVVSSPHSGRSYADEFMSVARLDEKTLRRSEDSYVDEIFAQSPSLGAPLIAATFPRAFCDVNREAWELDPAMFEDTLPAWVNTTSPRVGAGLGTIARVVANGEAIYGIRLRFAEAQRRVRGYWQPYHDALSGLVDTTRARFGMCVLLDCHSMPSGAASARRPAPDIVLGDAHGIACDPRVMRCAEQFFTQRGYLTRRNDPYAGGYVTRHYGQPRANVHALQIEIARGLYMDELTLEKRPGFGRVSEDAADFVSELAGVAGELALLG
jgi:N-formylglutamate deformylase